MSCQIINAHTFLQRIGTSAERKNDRRICAKMMLWGINIGMKKAREEHDYEMMEYWEREMCLTEAL